MKDKTNERISLIQESVTSYGDTNGNQRQSSRLGSAEASCTSWWYVLCFGWVIPILTLGYKRTLTDDDFDDLANRDKAAVLLNEVNVYDWATTSTRNAIIKTFWKEFIFAGILFIPHIIARMMQPFLLRHIFLSIHNSQAPFSIVYPYIILLFICSIISPFVFQQSLFRTCRIGLRIRNTLTALIYARLLSINAATLLQINTSQIINLTTIDAAKFADSLIYLHYLWEGPLEATIAFCLLCWIVGILPTLCVYIIFIMLIPTQLLFSRKLNKYYQTIATCTDKRLQAYRELINGCHIIKMYSWEEAIKKRIDVIRQEEVANIRKTSRLRAFNMSIFFSLLPLITLVTVVSSWLVGFSLTAIDIFTAVSIYGLIRAPVVNFLPQAIEKLIQMNISIKRIDKFIRLQQSQQQILHSFETDDNQPKGTISMQNASFSWQGNVICLSSLNIDIKHGSLVNIVGPIGSGKSSLFAAILGEMHLVNGQMYINKSSISYASQYAWIFADTLRGNILLDKPFDRERYTNVLHACCLDVDLNTFGSGGDLTVIGEKGVNLSGGQRSRVSLARALYVDADIYLLDDPLASVDGNVAKQIYDQCIGPNGLLNKKTRLLITHQTQYLSEVDQILYLVQGKIQSQDSFKEFKIEHKTIDRMDNGTNIETATLNKMLGVEQSTVDTGSIIEDEISVKGSVSWSVWLDLFTKSSTDWFGICLLVILLLLGQIFYDVSNALLNIFSKHLYGNHHRSSLYLYIYISITLATLLIGILRANYFFYVFLNGADYLHNKMLDGLINTSIRFYESNPTGRILNRASRDQHVVDEILPMTLFDSVQSSLLALGSLCILCLANPWILIILVPFTAVYFILHNVYVRSNHQLKRLESVTRSPMFTLFASSLDGLVTIRALKVDDYFLRIFINRIDANTRAYINMIGASQWFGFVLDLVNSTFSVTIIALTIFFHNQLNESLVVVILLYSITIKGNFQWGFRQGIESEILMTSTERIREYTKLPNEEDFGGQQGIVSTSEDWPNQGSIEFQNYSLRYRADLEPALKDISLSIKSNEKIGIIGRTGAGKSSFFQGLFRFVDRSNITGQILIDGIDISRITLKHLRSHISVIPQQPVLFSGTLRYNLDPLDHHTDAECWMALEIVQLKKLIADHPHGLHLILTESGVNFSAGQCQLICAARAILKKSKILLIDEATANVDRETDSLIQNLMAEKLQDRTILTIAHRLDTVVQSDRILVLNKGRTQDLDVSQNILLQYQ